LKTFVISFCSFALGFIVAGYFGFKMYVASSQSMVLIQNQIYTQVIEYSLTDKQDQLITISCMALGYGIDNYEMISDSFLASDSPSYTATMVSDINDKAKSIVDSDKFCNRIKPSTSG
jgi:hypothetical protein